MITMQTPASPTVAFPPPSGLEVAADIAIIAVAVLLFLVLLSLLFAVLGIRRGISKVQETLGRLEPGGHAVLERARSVSEHVEAITRTVRDDVDRVTDSVSAVSARLQQASDRMEERIEDFNALMEVVQEEAEGIFVDTASTVRGVRGSARALRGPREPHIAAASADLDRSPAPLVEGSPATAETPPDEVDPASADPHGNDGARRRLDVESA